MTFRSDSAWWKPQYGAMCCPLLRLPAPRATQNVPLALTTADMGYVLHVGRIVAQGSRDELKKSEAVKKASQGG